MKHCAVVETSIIALQQLLVAKRPCPVLDMDYNKILNPSHPRNPTDDSDYENDVVAAKVWYNYVKIAD